MDTECRVCGEVKERFGVQVLPKMNVTPQGIFLGKQQPQATAAYFAFEVCCDCVELGLIFLCTSARHAALKANAEELPKPDTIKITQENPDDREEGS